MSCLTGPGSLFGGTSTSASPPLSLCCARVCATVSIRRHWSNHQLLRGEPSGPASPQHMQKSIVNMYIKLLPIVCSGHVILFPRGCATSRVVYCSFYPNMLQLACVVMFNEICLRPPKPTEWTSGPWTWMDTMAIANQASWKMMDKYPKVAKYRSKPGDPLPTNYFCIF